MKKKKLKIAFLSADDPRDKKIWSGTHHSIWKACLKIGETDILGPHRPALRLFLLKLLNRISIALIGKRIDYSHSIYLSKAYAKFFSKKLNSQSYDFVIASAASCELAFLRTKVPVIYVTDGTFDSCLNYHKTMSNLLQRSVKEGRRVEKLAIDKSKKVVVSSSWAEQSCINDYNCRQEKVVTIPFGANFEKVPNPNDILYEVSGPIKMIFVGVYWKEKGGDIALNTFQILKSKNIPVSLTILGCQPTDDIRDEDIRQIGFIDKNTDKGRDELFRIFSEQHLLILPTRFDCSPIVINEASAFGIPSLVSKTGGVEGHLKDGINGFTIDYNDKGEAYAAIIEKLNYDRKSFKELRKSSRKLYDKMLNWENWAAELERIISN